MLVEVLLFLLLYYVGTLFSRLVFVYTIQWRSTKICFCLVFALSVFTFALILSDASKFCEHSFLGASGSQVLRFTLMVNLVTIAVVSPLQVVCSLMWDFHLRYVLVTFMLIIMAVVYGTSAPLAQLRFAILRVDLRETPVQLLWKTICLVVSLSGILSVSILSGYAAVMTPLAFIRPRAVRESGDCARVALCVLAKRQRHLIDLWISRRHLIAHACSVPAYGGGCLGVRGPVVSDDCTDVGGGFLNWVARSIGLTAHRGDVNIAKLEAEESGIRNVSMAVFLQMSEMDSLVRSADRGSTWRGWVNGLVGVVLLMHTLVKFSSAIVGLLKWVALPDNHVALHREDMATKVMNFLEAYGLAAPHEDGAEQRVVWVSLILNAWMIISSIRGFLLTVFRFVTTNIAFLSLDTTVMMLTAGMGAFFVGQLVLLRLTPRLEHESTLYAVLREDLPQNRVYCHLNDLFFVMAGAATALMQRYAVSPGVVAAELCTTGG